MNKLWILRCGGIILHYREGPNVMTKVNDKMEGGGSGTEREGDVRMVVREERQGDA